MDVGDSAYRVAEWVVDRLFKKVLCASYTDNKLHGLPGKVYSKVLDQRLWPTVEQHDSVLVIEQQTSFLLVCESSLVCVL